MVCKSGIKTELLKISLALAGATPALNQVDETGKWNQKNTLSVLEKQKLKLTILQCNL